MSNETEIRGVVTKIFFSKPTFSAGRLRPAGRHGEVAFAGAVYVKEGDVVKLRGAWTTHEKFGEQFSVDGLVYEDELDADGLAVWLSQSGAAHGIGPVKAKRIATEYGESFGTILKEDPEQLAIFAGVPLANITRLADEWAKREGFCRLAIKLSAWGLTRHEIELLSQRFGPSVLTLLQENPYKVLGEIGGIGFVRIDDLARRLGFEKTHPGRVQAGVVHCLRQSLHEGSTCEDGRSLVSAAEEVLALDLPDSTERIREQIAGLLAAGKDLRCVPGDNINWYALAWILRYEKRIAQVLTCGQANRHTSAAWITDRLPAFCAPLNDASQEQAVATALRNRVSVITGGAGTGKTTVIRTLINAYDESVRARGPVDDTLPEEFGPDVAGAAVALCAPTGKAARRLTEVTGHEALTIHRLLGYSPTDGFVFNRDNPLPYDVVIVDEVSMVDSELGYHLTSALRKDTSLVLVGDHHQLPPVGPGALLRDCIKHQLAPLTVLAKCHRQAGTLKHNCNRLLDGVVERTAPKVNGWSPWIVQDRLDSPDDVLTCIEKLFKEILPGYGFKVPWEVQFMTPQHAGPIGTKAINVLLQRLHQESQGVTVAPTSPEARPKLYPGDKVICTRNNYTLDVMNGHVGQVLSVEPLLVDFDGRSVEIPKTCKGDIELAYCLTPHKMQGSEIPVAITICHRSHGHMLHRNWLYTACTRARAASILVGDTRGVSQAVQCVKQNNRKTLLGILAGK